MIYNDENLLEMVELYAAEIGAIDSEQELSDRFDQMIEECEITLDPDDEPMISECFNNWSDSLCKDGDIHPIQYNEYCYIGLYS